MGVGSRSATTDKPVFNDTSTTQADLQAAVDYAEAVGNHRVGTAAARAAWTKLANGLIWSETDTGKIYLYYSGAWVLLTEDTGWVPITLLSTFDVQGDVVPGVRRQNGRVKGRGLVKVKAAGGTFASGITLIGSLPTGFVPTDEWKYSVTRASSLSIGAGLTCMTDAGIRAEFSTAGAVWVSLASMDWFV